MYVLCNSHRCPWGCRPRSGIWWEFPDCPWRFILPLTYWSHLRSQMGKRECTWRNKLSLTLSNTLSARSFRLSLLRMSDGSPHPDAIDPIIIGTEFGPWRTIDEITIQATGCRLAVTVSLHNTPFDGSGMHDNLFIWDWKTGQKYLVSVVQVYF
jgi:hypothetical protein